MSKFWKWLGRLSDSTGVFGPILGSAAVTAILTWAASAWDLIAAHGWGAMVFAGVAATAVLLSAISLVLIGWRVFRPLPVAVVEASNMVTPTRTQSVPKDYGSDVQRLSEQLQGTKAKLDNLSVAVDAHIREVSNSPTRNVFFQEAMLTLMAIANLNMLIRKAPPPEEREPTAKFQAAAQGYLQSVTEADLGKERMRAINHALESAKADTERVLSTATPPDLPAADLLHYRDWAVSVSQVSRVVSTLEKMKAGAEQAFIALRGTF